MYKRKKVKNYHLLPKYANCEGAACECVVYSDESAGECELGTLEDNQTDRRSSEQRRGCQTEGRNWGRVASTGRRGNAEGERPLERVAERRERREEIVPRYGLKPGKGA